MTVVASGKVSSRPVTEATVARLKRAGSWETAKIARAILRDRSRRFRA